jgi:hypothetical protein
VRTYTTTKGESTTLKDFLARGRINFKISLEYAYSNDYARELMSFTLRNILFSEEKIPIGLRENGVIINPDEDEELENSNGRKNTFVINVKDIKNSEAINGFRIVFNTGQNVNPFFEIYLDTDGKICFASKDGIFKPTFS